MVIFLVNSGKWNLMFTVWSVENIPLAVFHVLGFFEFNFFKFLTAVIRTRFAEPPESKRALNGSRLPRVVPDVCSSPGIITAITSGE